MAKIFITGIAGFLGSHLADTMLSDGHEVAGIDNLIGGYIDNIPRGVSFFQCTDCNNFETMKTLIKGFDIVYHCAATAYEGLSVFSPHQALCGRWLQQRSCPGKSFPHRSRLRP